MAQHDFADHEAVIFERALRWWDTADAAAAEAERAEGIEQSRLTKLSLDASQAALRYWKALKFTAADTRRPGRPSGADWSAARKAAAGSH